MRPKKIVKRREPVFSDVKKWFEENLDAETIDLDDQEVYENVYHDGKWAAVFQFTESGAQKFATEAKPRSILDIATITSIYRPGPLLKNAHKLYVENKEKLEKGENLEYVHPILEKILSESKGLMTFQEQFMVIGRELGDLPWSDCDKLRKILVKKSIGTDVNDKKARQAAEIKEKFRKGATAKGMTDEQVDELWDAIAAWSGYGFNKCLGESHCVDVYDVDGDFEARKSIRNVANGSFVKSRDEKTGDVIFTEVTAVHKNGMKPVFEYTLDDGKTVLCTPDHKFRTTDGRMLPIAVIAREGLSISMKG